MSNELATKIKDNLKLREVMEFYGVEFNGRGFARCPFHTEKTASLSIKNEHYKCFGCGAYGSVIDFVMNYHGLKFMQAVVKLSSDFNLDITNSKPSYRQQAIAIENKRIEQAYNKWLSERKANYAVVCDVRRKLYGLYIDGAEHLADMIDWLDMLLDNYIGEGALAWEIVTMRNWSIARTIS